MKNLFYVLLFTFFVLIFISCEDNSSNPDTNSFQKIKITIYASDDEDSTKFYKESEYFFDGDANGMPRRAFLQILGSANYQSELDQYRANVPLPYNKFGCLLKNIEYSDDSSYFMITTCEYDKAGYLTKVLMDSYSDLNSSSYGTYKRESENLILLNYYENNILEEIRKMYLDKNGLCTLEVDSNPKTNEIKYYVWRSYNEKHQLIYQFMGDDTANGSATEYFYDAEGNNIQTKEYYKYQSDTSSTQIYNKVLYKGYLMDPEDIEYFEFDSENRIVGFTNTDFGNTKYKIEYEYY